MLAVDVFLSLSPSWFLRQSLRIQRLPTQMRVEFQGLSSLHIPSADIPSVCHDALALYEVSGLQTQVSTCVR